MPYTMQAAEENFSVAPEIARTTVPLVGTPGVPVGSVKVIQDVLTLFGIPPWVTGIILPMDRLLDMLRSAVNVCGDLFTAGVTDDLCRREAGNAGAEVEHGM